MGLFGKIKNIFYDEEIVEIEEPTTQEIKKEESPRIEEVKLPKREAPKEREVVSKPVSPVYTERELFKSEPTFKFPVIDEEDEEPIRTRTRPNILDLERNTRREVKESKPEIKFPERSFKERSSNTEKSSSSKEETIRTFRPSPVISPVYGVLDKNYKKEEIIERQHHNNIRHNPSDMNYDSIRRKAYGTLEDELENTLTKISSKTDQVMQTIEEVEKLDTEANSKSIEELLNEIEGNRDLSNVSIGEIEERIKDRMEEEETDNFIRHEDIFKKEEPIEEEHILNSAEEVKEDTQEVEEKPKEESADDGFDKTLEHDLFNLIDSMYEEREGE